MKKRLRFHVGLRTLKTTAAVIISMLIVNAYGTTDSKLIFAMLGAMAAVQPTFKESVQSCLTQIVGVMVGALLSIVLLALPLHRLVITGVGIVLVISLYNMLRIQFSPSLPCFIVVMLCTTADIEPLAYGIGRVWDSAIGLGVGMLINMLVFPYDNSRRIRELAQSLDREIIVFLEEMFDGDEVLPKADRMVSKIDDIAQQLRIFSNQKLLLRLRSQSRDIQRFRLCEGKARELLAQMEVLCRMDAPGRLNGENRRRLEDCGACIRDLRPMDSEEEADVVTNYHVGQILALRSELLDVLQR